MKEIKLNYTVISESGEVTHYNDVLPVKYVDGKYIFFNHSFSSFEAIQDCVSLLVDTIYKPAVFDFTK